MQAAKVGDMHAARVKLEAATDLLRKSSQADAATTVGMLTDLQNLHASCADKVAYSSARGGVTSTYQVLFRGSVICGFKATACG
jgi:hypothetical protein